MATKVKITVSKGPQGVAGPQGFQGSQGPSAYEVWLSEGNSGTVQDYLDSLVGEEGIQGETGVVADLNSVPDVDTSGGVTGQVLTQQSDGSFALENVAQSLFDLTDTEQAGGIAANSTLTYIGGKWKNTAPASPPPSPTLENLTDTVLTTPADGQFLKYNGTEWINAQVDLPWTATGSDIYYNTGNVGIGTATPSEPLHVVGKVRIDGGVIVLDQGASGNDGLLITSNPSDYVSETSHVSVRIGRGAGQLLAPSAQKNVAIGNEALGRSTASYNVAIGFRAAKGMNGGYNVVVGDAAGNQDFYPATNPRNVILGYQASQQSSAGDNVVIGYDSSRYTTGGQNVAIGRSAAMGVSGTSTFANTVAVGYQALTALTTGAGNTAVGYQAGVALTTGTNNTFLGYGVGLAATDRSNNVLIGKDVAPSSTTINNTIAIGSSVLYSATTAGAGNSVFIGHEVGKNITTGSASNNVYIGYQAGLNRNGQYEKVAIGTSAGTGGSSHIAIGRNSMNIGGSSSLGIGHGVGANNSGAETVIIGNTAGQYGATTESVLVGNWTARSAGGNYSVMMGHRANQGGTSHNSVHIGHSSGRENDGDSNVAVGYQTISETTTGSTISNSVALGYQALKGTTTSTAAGVVAVGYQALTALTTGTSNTAVGYQAGNALTTGNQNTFIGYEAAKDVAQNTKWSVAVGYQALNTPTGTQVGSTAIGYMAGWQSGLYNSFVGYQAGASSGGNTYSAALGWRALSGDNQGTNYSVGVGHNAGRTSNGDYNVLIGANTGDTYNSSFSNTVAVGYEALTELTTGASNTAVGYQALTALTTGIGNTAVGYQAGSSLLTGSSNFIVGVGAGAALTTGSANILLGQNAGNKVWNQGNNIAIGNNALFNGTAGENIAIGNEAIGNGGTGVAVGGSAGRFGMTHGTFVGIAAGYLGGDSSVGLGKWGGAYLSGDRNVSVGFKAGQGVAYTSNTSNNVFIGYEAGAAITSGGSNVLIGYQAGSALTTEANKLYIENSNSATPLIYGEFDTDLVRVNGKLEVKNENFVIGTANSVAGSGNNNFNGTFEFANGPGTYQSQLIFRPTGNASGYNHNYWGSIGWDPGSGLKLNAANYTDNIWFTKGIPESSNPLAYGKLNGTGLKLGNTYFASFGAATERLDVVGNIKASGAIKVSGIEVGDTASTGYALPAATGTTGQALVVNASGDVEFGDVGIDGLSSTYVDTDIPQNWKADSSQIIGVGSFGTSGVEIAFGEGHPRDLFFKPDGTRLFMVGNGRDDIQSVDLPTAWDLSSIASTATVTSVDLAGSSAIGGSGFEDSLYGMHVANDPNDTATYGKKFFISGEQRDEVQEYTCTTAWDLSTMSADATAYLSLTSTPHGNSVYSVTFNPDGTIMYVGRAGNPNTFSHFDLSTAWDLSTAVYNSSKSTNIVVVQEGGQNEGYVINLAFNEDGTKAYFTGRTRHDLHTTTLSTAWDLSTYTDDNIALHLDNEYVEQAFGTSYPSWNDQGFNWPSGLFSTPDYLFVLFNTNDQIIRLDKKYNELDLESRVSNKAVFQQGLRSYGNVDVIGSLQSESFRTGGSAYFSGAMNWNGFNSGPITTGQNMFKMGTAFKSISFVNSGQPQAFPAMTSIDANNTTPGTHIVPSSITEACNIILPVNSGEVLLDTTPNLYHNAFDTEAAAKITGATEIVEYYYTARTDGQGKKEAFKHNVPAPGQTISRKVYYANKAFADPDTPADWTLDTSHTSYSDATTAAKALLNAASTGAPPLTTKVATTGISLVDWFTITSGDMTLGYSLRLINPLYTGAAIRVINDSNVEADIGFVEEALDTTALLSHCGSGDGYVVKFYDQSQSGGTGSGNDASYGNPHVTPVNKPKIVSAGAVLLDNGKPCMFVEDSSLELESQVDFAPNGTLVAYVASKDASADTNSGMILGDYQGTGNNSSRIWEQTTHIEGRVYNSGTNFGFVSPEDVTVVGAGQKLVSFYRDSSVYWYMDRNSVTSGTSLNRNYNFSVQTLFNAHNSNDYAYHGNVQEIVMFNSDKSSERAAIQSNINTYYSIY